MVAVNRSVRSWLAVNRREAAIKCTVGRRAMRRWPTKTSPRSAGRSFLGDADITLLSICRSGLDFRDNALQTVLSHTSADSSFPIFFKGALYANVTKSSACFYID